MGGNGAGGDTPYCTAYQIVRDEAQITEETEIAELSLQTSLILTIGGLLILLSGSKDTRVGSH